MTAAPPHIRPARPQDLPALLAMQARSLRGLAGPFYAPEQIEAFLTCASTMDPRVIEDGTYWLVELDGRLAGGAGHMNRPVPSGPLPPTPLRSLPPRHGPVAIVRSVFVDPTFARHGLGRRLMEHVEARMRAAGVATAELMATLAGVPLYRACGYLGFEEHALALPGGLDFPVLRMAKRLPAAATLAQAA